MINNSINKKNLMNIMDFSEKNNLFEYIQELSFSIEEIYDFDKEKVPEDIKTIYYNAYFIIFNSLRVNSNENKDTINECLKKAAHSLEILAKLDLDELDSNELLFDAMLTYYISNNYPCAYVLSKSSIISLPKFKEVIFQFFSKNFVELRETVLTELNSKELDENFIIKELKQGKIDKFEALNRMLSYSIFKTFNDLLNFLYIGDKSIIDESLVLLSKYKNIALDNKLVDYFWIINVLEYLIKEVYTNSLWNQLKDFRTLENNDILDKYIRNYLNRNTPIIELWPSQVKSISKIIENNDNLTLKMPTSAGKTFVAELTILKFLINRTSSKKVVYISPFRSLSNEIELSLNSSLGNLGFKISEFYGSFDSNPYESYVIEELDVLILTPEKFDVLLRINSSLRNNIGLIIIDEGHIIGNHDERSANIEFFVYRLKNMFKDSRFLFISGVLPNIEEFSKWLSNGEDTNLINEKWKPSDLLIGTLEWNRKEGAFINYKFRNDVHSDYPNMKFMDVFDNKEVFKSHSRKKFPNYRNEALALSALKFAKEAPTFVFSPTKIEINSLAKKILEVITILKDINCNYNICFNNDDKDVLDFIFLVKEELGENSELINYVKNGFLIHHADLPDNIKISIENLLRNEKFNLVIGTSTLIQGVNFPIKTVILKNIWVNGKFIDSSTFLNICGRAGRAGKEKEGRVLLFIDNIAGDSKNRRKIGKYSSLLKYNDDIKSIFFSILDTLKKFHDNYEINLTFEEYCFLLFKKFYNDDFDSQNETIIELFNNINLLDSQLLAFIEESSEDLDLKSLVNEFVKLSLYHNQIYDNDDYFRDLIKSRLYYLKKEYSPVSRKKLYKLGFNLKDCKLIEFDYNYLNNLFLRINNWYNLSNSERIDLLYGIGKYIFKLSIFSDSEFPFKEEILKLWIQGLSSIKILNYLSNDELELNKINSLINSFKYSISWGVSSIITFLSEDNNSFNDISEYISEMFKYGIFDLKIIKLMTIFNNLELCKELSPYIDEEDSIEYIIEKFEHISLNISDYNLSYEITNSLLNYFNDSKYDENNSKIIIKLDKSLDFNINDFLIIKSYENDEISIFNLNGEYIERFKSEDYSFEEFDFDLKYNDIWKVNLIKDNTLILVK